jgi:DNA repair protein RadC
MDSAQVNWNHYNRSGRSWQISVSEKLALYGSSALSGIEHLRLLVGQDSLADALVRHFGSLQALQRASFRELRQFLTTRQAESVMAGLCISSVVDTEEALAGPLNTPEAVYAANREMRWLRQEVVRVLLLNSHYFCVTTADVCKGTVDESIAHPRDIFRPVIVYAAAGFVLVHNHPSGDASPSSADIKLTKAIEKGARILGLTFLDHVIVGQPITGGLGYYSFREGGIV